MAPIAFMFESRHEKGRGCGDHNGHESPQSGRHICRDPRADAPADARHESRKARGQTPLNLPAGAEIRKKHKPHQRQPVQEMSYILQVPAPFFFEGAPQVAGRVGKDAEAPWPAYVSDFLASSDGLKLIRAFTQIGDAKLRRSLVRVVEEIADESDN
jgi:hypothetical protein